MQINNLEKRRITLNLFQKKGIGSKQTVKLINNLANLSEGIDNIELGKSLLDNSSEILLAKLDIKYKCFWEEDFPKDLFDLENYPAIIFYRGDWDIKIFEKSISVVGTRHNSEYGNSVTKKIISELKNIEVTIISGMAMGIDSIAHLSALESNLKTVAVLASGLERATPIINEAIFKKIINNGGLVISEFSPNTKIVPGMFANRNRLIAALSKVVIVTEAPVKSGSLITTEIANKINRPVFAVPGSILSRNSEGCNDLIKKSKAQLLIESNQILEALGISREASKEEMKNLNSLEKQIYDIVFSENLNLELLAKKLNLAINEVSSLCSMLELKGILKKDFSGNFYIV